MSKKKFYKIIKDPGVRREVGKATLATSKALLRARAVSRDTGKRRAKKALFLTAALILLGALFFRRQV